MLRGSRPEALDGMAFLNKSASDAAKQFEASAATDITGFGLAVHACEMAQASNVTLSIELERLAILPGAIELAKRGFITRANKTNREFSRDMVNIDAAADESLLEMVFDPQTSGGLLISVSEKQSEQLISQVNDNGPGTAQIVGAVLPKQEHAIHLG